MECLALFEMHIGNYILPFGREIQKILYLTIYFDVYDISMRNEAEPDRLEKQLIVWVWSVPTQKTEYCI